MMAPTRLSGVIIALALPTMVGATVYTAGYTNDTVSANYNYSGYNARYPAYDSFQIGLYGATTYSAFCSICTGGSSGTTTPGTGATASVDQAYRAVLGAYTATAYGRANLTTAQLGISAFGTNYTLGGYNYYVRSRAVAGLSDGLDFKVLGGSPTTEIGVTVDLRGVMTGQSSLLEQVGFGSANFFNQISSTVSAGPSIVSSSAAGWVSYDFSPSTSGHIVFRGVYQLTGASEHVNIGDFLFADSSGGYSDYAHTSDFSLQLPRGVSFASDSGVFLTGTGGVPEPASWAMIVSGAALTGAAMRRRRIATTAC